MVSVLRCLSVCVLGWIIFGSAKVYSSAYISTDDWRIRQDLFTLSNAGVLSSSVTSFPIAWDAVITQLRDNRSASLHWSVEQARIRLLHSYKNNIAPLHVSTYAKASSSPPRVASETKAVTKNTEIGVRSTYLADTWLVNIDMSLAPSPIDRFDQNYVSFDGSYAGVQLGNWLLSVGYLQHKFGPGNDTQLFRSANAEAPPSFYISRVIDAPFETSWLSWIGHWKFINGVSLLNDERAINDALLWTMRASFKPLDFLEVGVSKAAQLC